MSAPQQGPSPGRKGQAFKSVLLKKRQHRRLECCATHRNYVFIGVSSSFEVFHATLSPIDGEWELPMKQSVAAPSGKPVTQISILADLELVCVLSDGAIYLYAFHPPAEHQRDGSGGRLVSETPKGTVGTAGRPLSDCTMFTVKKAYDRYTLAAVLRGRVTIFEWHGRSFEQTKDLKLPPEAPRACLWNGPKLLLCFPREYDLLDVETGQQTPLRTVTCTPVACYMHGFNENVILPDDSIGSRLKINGKPGAKGGVYFTNHPKQMVYHHPFLLSLHGNTLEVHFPHHTHQSKSASFCQGFNLANSEMFNGPNLVSYDEDVPAKREPGLMPRDASIVLCGDGSIRLIAMIELDKQISILSRHGEFDEASALCSVCANEVNDTLRQQLALQHGNFLFGKNDFEGAMKKFKDGDADPRYVISFFRGYSSSGLDERFSPAVKIMDQVEIRVDELSDPDQRAQALLTLLGYLNALRNTPPPHHRFPLRDVDLRDADDRVCLFAAVDTAVAHCSFDFGLGDVVDIIRRPNYVVLESLEAKFRAHGEFALLGLLYLTLRDTAAIRGALEVLRNVAIFNNPTPEFEYTPERALPTATTIAHAVERGQLQGGRFYTVKELSDEVTAGNGRSALSAEAVKSIAGVSTTIHMLRNLEGETRENEDVIVDFAPWVLRAVPPSYAVSLFTGGEAGDGTVLSRRRTAQFLEAYPRVANEYLAAVLGPKPDRCDDADLHTRRIRAILAVLSDEKVPETDRTVLLEQLYEFMSVSTRYDPVEVQAELERVPTKLGGAALLKPQTLVLRRMGRHEQAIRLLLSMEKHREAEEYASAVNEARVADAAAATGPKRSGPPEEDPFKFLLAAYVNPSGTDVKPNVNAAIDIVRRHPGMDPVAALKVLPDDIPVAQLSSFLMASLRNSTSELRFRQVRKNVLQSRLRQLQVEAAQAKSLMLINPQREKCAKCRNSMEKTNFVRYPNGVMVHPYCAPNKQVCPVTGVDFSKRIDVI